MSLRAIIVAVLASVAFTTTSIAEIPGVLELNVGMLYGSKAGVDQDDQLWFWNRQTGTVTRFAHTGEAIVSRRLPPSVSVDADGRRGIAALIGQGEKVQVRSWDGRLLQEIALGEAAGDIAWMTGSLIAVTPRVAAHRVQVWDVDSGALRWTMAPVLPISQGPGQHLVRSTLVRYDHQRNEVVALDATFGDLFVFTAAGVLRREVRLPGATPPIHHWLTTGEENQGGASTNYGLLRHPTMSIAPDGVVWVADGNRRGSVRMLKVRGENVQQVQTEISSCRSRNVQVWHQAIIVFGTPESEAPCTAVVEIKDTRSIREGRRAAAAGAPLVHRRSVSPKPELLLPGIRPNASECPVLTFRVGNNQECDDCSTRDVQGCCEQRWCDDPQCKCPPAPSGWHLDFAMCLCDYSAPICARYCRYVLN